jgi:hypothetical protein
VCLTSSPPGLGCCDLLSGCDHAFTSLIGRGHALASFGNVGNRCSKWPTVRGLFFSLQAAPHTTRTAVASMPWNVTCEAPFFVHASARARHLRRTHPPTFLTAQLPAHDHAAQRRGRVLHVPRVTQFELGACADPPSRALPSTVTASCTRASPLALS